MFSSSFFTIGKTHNVCQDYALAGTIQPYKRTYAVLSDGCSSVAHTDIGARLVVLNAVEQLRNNFIDHSSLGYFALAQSKAYLKSNISALNEGCLAATLLVAEELADGNVRASVFGDGFILARNRNKTIDILQIDFRNYPFYPLYLLSDDNIQEYFQKGIRTKSVITTTLDPLSTRILGTSVADIEYTYEDFISKTRQQKSSPIEMWTNVFSKEQYDLIMLSSDGIDSFFSKDGIHMLSESVIAQLIDIKTFTGEFMLRRGRAVTRDVCEAKGWMYYDDVSLAAIYLGGNCINEGLHQGK